MAKKARKTSKSVNPTFAGLQNNNMNGSELSTDYTEIKAELKKIAILAVSFFAILIALSFVIN